MSHSHYTPHSTPHHTPHHITTTTTPHTTTPHLPTTLRTATQQAHTHRLRILVAASIGSAAGFCRDFPVLVAVPGFPSSWATPTLTHTFRALRSRSLSSSLPAFCFSPLYHQVGGDLVSPSSSHQYRSTPPYVVAGCAFHLWLCSTTSTLYSSQYWLSTSCIAARFLSCTGLTRCCGRLTVDWVFFLFLPAGMELQALHSLVLFFSMLDRLQPHAWDFADGLQLRACQKKKTASAPRTKEP